MSSFQGGLFFFQLMDNYAASGLPLLWVAFFQTAAISWAFGTERFADCIEKMTGVRPGLVWRLCWGIFAPACMAVSQLSHNPFQELSDISKRQL